MSKTDYTSIRVTKKVKESLQKYVEECYDDLSINSMLKVHIENLNDGHVRFPKYGMYECPESRKQKMQGVLLMWLARLSQKARRRGRVRLR